MTETPELETQLRDEFTPKLKDVTLETLPALINDLMNREHDYGSICVAIGIAAAATGWACNRHEHGGITGFQSGAVFWEFVKAWGSPSIGKSGARIINFDDLLYPQYAEKFTGISEDTLQRVRALAAENIASKDMASASVVAHWQSIVDGAVPFGLSVTA